MQSVFAWIEQTPLSRWVVGSDSFFAFPGILVVHTFGVGFVAGPNIAIGLRLLGAARRVPLTALTGVFPVIWIGLAANVVSGVLLLIGYPTKALTNPVFYVKLGCIALGLALMVRIRDTVLRAAPAAGAEGAAKAVPGAAVMAWASLALWVGAITAGRLLAYTYSHLTARDW